MKPYYKDDHVTIYNCDAREILPELPKVDLVLTDPPYPDYLAEEYHYKPDGIDFLKGFNCLQFVFWSGRADFPLNYTAIHIWNKNPSNHGAQYERIFERNGGSHYKVYTFYMNNSTVAAQMTGDTFENHESQKPIKLIRTLIEQAGERQTILDPFAGSCTTGRAAKDLNRKAILVELEEKYCEIGALRMSQEVMQF